MLFALGAVEAVGIEDLRRPLLFNLLLLVSSARVARLAPRRPLAAILTIVAAAILQAAVATDASEFAATFAALLLVSVQRRRLRLGPRGFRRPGGSARAGRRRQRSGRDADDARLPVPGGLALCCWLAGRAVRHRSRLTEAMHELAVRAEEDREACVAPSLPTSAVGSRARCTTSWPTRSA